ncbi:hypothetical protein PhaeoP128_01463 [Phaeobacter gallaeciensis]|nr:hypothetical protein PhaeoP129_01463 [Phaeobacter gallaeciensis]ATF22209.1 hypothetical protein PhaeoP128_01463 [Phaeobacter gallaeciensis]
MAQPRGLCSRVSGSGVLQNAADIFWCFPGLVLTKGDTSRMYLPRNATDTTGGPDGF